jgi:LmbE family N-acetylglucosaminyl deacetylase
MPEASRILVISQHFDDAVFSCGAWIASNSNAVVCTVFAGCPDTRVATDWDHQCGFSDARQAMRERIAVDDRALELLGATGERLNFLDAQYVPYGDAPTTVNTVERVLCTIIRSSEPATLVIPLGLYHSDHVLTHMACRNAWRSSRGLTCIAYEDALYRRIDGLVQQRLADLLANGIAATPEASHEHPALAKRNAVGAYTSQLKAFGPHGYDDVYADEHYWRLGLATQ